MLKESRIPRNEALQRLVEAERGGKEEGGLRLLGYVGNGQRLSIFARQIKKIEITIKKGGTDMGRRIPFSAPSSEFQL